MNRTRRLGTIALTGLSVTLLAACAAPPSAPSAVVAPAHLPPASAVAVAATPTSPASPVAAPSPTTTSVPTPAPATASSAAPSAAVVDVATQQPPHFDTPEAAMRYLVDAYNAHDMTAERHVTTPDSRDQLETERQWVNTFRFNSCTPGVGDYSCTFDMVSMVASAAPSASSDASQMNEITVLVAPAKTPGWYMSANEGCGDAMHG